MIKFSLENGQKIIPTSPHGCRFSDGTIFDPSEEDVSQIRKDWACLTVEREFAAVASPLLRVGVVRSTQSLTSAGRDALDECVRDNPTTIILVSFMVIATIREMGLRSMYPTVLATNATAETARSRPDEKVWNTDRFSW